MGRMRDAIAAGRFAAFAAEHTGASIGSEPMS
jgi:hypothetical protein